MQPHFASRQRGSVLIVAALSLVALMGAFALSVDLGSIYSQRRQIQAAADAVALAGASEGHRNADELDQSSLAIGKATKEALALGFTQQDMEIGTEKIFRDGGHSLDIRVQLQRSYSTHILGLFGIPTVPIVGRATAGSVGIALEDCLLVMDPRKDKAIEVKKKASLSAPGCGIHVNSTGKLPTDPGSPPDEKEALTVKTDAAGVSAKSITVVGRVNSPHGSITVTAPPNTVDEKVTVRIDPVGGIKRPPVGNCKANSNGDSKPFKVADNQNLTLVAGTYCGIEIGKGADVVLDPGVYVLKDKGIVVKEKATLRGSKVTFFLTATPNTVKDFSPLILKEDKDDEYKNGFEVSLASPVLGDLGHEDYAGVLMFQDMQVEGRKKKSPGDWGGKLQLKKHKDSKNVADCNGKTDDLCQTLRMDGLVHIPGMHIVVGKKASFIGERTLIVARTLKLEDESSMVLNASTSTLPNGTPFRRVTLVR